MLIYSVGLNTTDDYISAIKAAQTITNDQASLFGFPYSLFYVYFEQYLLIGDEAIRGILTALGIIFVTIVTDNFSCNICSILLIYYARGWCFCCGADCWLD